MSDAGGLDMNSRTVNALRDVHNASALTRHASSVACQQRRIDPADSLGNALRRKHEFGELARARAQRLVAR